MVKKLSLIQIGAVEDFYMYHNLMEKMLNELVGREEVTLPLYGLLEAT